MKHRKHILKTAFLITAAGMFLSPASHAEVKPVKVFIMSGQSNMVGFGSVYGGNSRWGKEFTDAEVSVYEGAYDPAADYDSLKPKETLKLESFGGSSPSPFPESGGGTYVVRGHVQLKESGRYRFSPGYEKSTYNIMEVGGKEVHRKEIGGESKFTDIKMEAGQKLPFKITYFDNSKGLLGAGWLIRLDPPKALNTAVQYEGKYPYLLDSDRNWKKRDDVFYKGVLAAIGSDWLNPLAGGGRIGPELGFGHKVGDHIEEPVLLLKSSMGNRALGWDFLPPGSERYEYEGKIFAGYKDTQMFWEKGAEPEPGGWYAGKQYDDCFGAAHEVLKNFDKNFPDWAGRGYEIVGFVWWQGDRDRYTPAHSANYEKNLVQLIKSLRKEFNAPNAKFVLGTLGQTVKGAKPEDSQQENEQMMMAGKFAVDGTSGKYPEFKDNVATVYTHPMARGGASNAHYSGQSEVYMDVGLAFGEAMVDLLKKEQTK